MDTKGKQLYDLCATDGSDKCFLSSPSHSVLLDQAYYSMMLCRRRWEAKHGSAAPGGPPFIDKLVCPHCNELFNSSCNASRHAKKCTGHATARRPAKPHQELQRHVDAALRV